MVFLCQLLFQARELLGTQICEPRSQLSFFLFSFRQRNVLLAQVFVLLFHLKCKTFLHLLLGRHFLFDALLHLLVTVAVAV